MKSIGKEAIKAVAAKNGVSVEEVEREIAAVIASYAPEQSKNGKDEIKPDEWIEQMAAKVKKQ